MQLLYCGPYNCCTVPTGFKMSFNPRIFHEKHPALFKEWTYDYYKGVTVYI